jgi:hypothetical protein
MLKHFPEVLICDDELIRRLMSNPVEDQDAGAAGFMWLRDTKGKGYCWPVVPGPDMRRLR